MAAYVIYTEEYKQHSPLWTDLNPTPFPHIQIKSEPYKQHPPLWADLVNTDFEPPISVADPTSRPFIDIPRLRPAPNESLESGDHFIFIPCGDVLSTHEDESVGLVGNIIPPEPAVGLNDEKTIIKIDTGGGYVTVYSNGAPQAGWSVSSTPNRLSGDLRDREAGFDYVLNPPSPLSITTVFRVAVYIEDYGERQLDLPSSNNFYEYSFKFKVRGDMPFSTLPIGAFYCDNVKLLEATGFAFYNRFPSPQINAGIESCDEPFDMSQRTVLIFKTGKRLLTTLLGSPSDSISKNPRMITCPLATFIPAHEGKLIQISNSAVGNNGDYTISEVVDAHHIVVYETPSSDEAGSFLNVLMEDGIYTRDTEESITLEPEDFVVPGNVDAEEFIFVFNPKAIHVQASLSKDETRVRFVTEFEYLEIDTESSTSPNPLAISLGTRSAVYHYEAWEDEPIICDIATLSSAQLTRVKMKARIAGVSVDIWDSQGPVTAPGWIVTKTEIASPGAAFNDIWRLTAEHSLPFISQDKIEVTLFAERDDALTEEESYTFVVRDYTPPAITSILIWSHETLRIEFSEPMTLDSETIGAATYIRTVQTRFKYHTRYNIGTELSPVWKANVLEGIDADFSLDEVGLFLGSAYALHSSNNGGFKITEWLSKNLICLDAAFVDESFTDLQAEDLEPLITISSYRLVPLPESTLIQPIFTPIPKAASEIDPLILTPYADTSRYTMLTFNDVLTPAVTYRLEVSNAKDANEVPTTVQLSFTSWLPYNPPHRNFSLWNFIPGKNKDEDTSKDLERLVRCLDECCQVILADVDDFGNILDPNKTRESVIAPLLQHLGNPFSFVQSLSLQRKRDLVYTLVPMYMNKGIAKGVESISGFLTGKTLHVRPWNTPSDTWTLGVSQLGYNTYLGPSRSSIRYTFYIEHTEDLDDAEIAIITEIANNVKPAHTHFYGFIKA